MKLLRAYLLVRLPLDEVEVTTHRNLESIESLWRGCSHPEASAALHVGYWRPETEDFLEALKAYPGRMLVSASAMHALPEKYRSSRNSIGSAGNLPLHLALAGWGYEIEDSIISQIESDGCLEPCIRDTPETPIEVKGIQCEWLRGFAKSNPAVFQQALDEGVVDEESYLELEGNLSVSLQNSMGEARFRWYCPVPSSDNIIDYIAFTPLWFQSLPISSLTLSKRPANIIFANSIHVIGDFRRYQARKVLAFLGMGRKSFNEIGTRLLEVLSGGATSAVVKAHSDRETCSIEQRVATAKGVQPYISFNGSGEYGVHDSIQNTHEKNIENMITFAEAVEVAFDLLTEQERRILRMRMGVEGDPMTLQEIGEEQGVTRERIRQIESRCVRRLRGMSYWNTVLGPKIRRILQERDDYLSPQGLEILDPGLKGASRSLCMLEYILEKLVEPELYLIRENGQCFVTEIKQQEWHEAVRSARNLLEGLAEKRLSFDEARNLVDGLLVGRGRELRGELWAVASKNAHFADGKLVAYGAGAEHIVLAILESSEAPLHYSDIHRSLTANGHNYDLRRIHNAAAEVGYLYARGTYGTMRHFPLDETQKNIVISEAEDLIGSESVARQWHAREICDHLEERGIDCDGNLSPYIVSIALNDSRYLTYLGRMVWAAKSSGATGVANRLDMHQAVVSILIDYGAPMIASEIKARLSSERGVNTFFQIQPEGPLVRVGGGVWGLMDRDVPFSEEESRRVMEALRATLLETEKGIHSSEIIDKVSGIEPLVRRVNDPVLLLGLAQKFEGFSVSKGQYLYLSKWGEPRRMNVNEAMTQVLKDAGLDGITIQDGMDRVSEMIERPFPINTFFGQIAFHLGALYDPTTKRWQLSDKNERSPDTEDDEEVWTAIS
ncbi:sigma factor-like helix-turn-helix DNA-binding protein [Alcaligenes faecalis subsp. phenolicus]|uniref:sigma factor-like helix-turn-helix DNA-binding protein n=1 Tax=Alcaligenes nematophilus TaxID=2994643 RepID=UPI002AA422F8|nr:sigma factor-like helix-turn-helix DNA-binding protein [Alcaligenes phenolicus]